MRTFLVTAALIVIGVSADAASCCSPAAPSEHRETSIRTDRIDTPVIEHYLAIHAALAKDRLNGVKASADKIAKVVGDTAIEASARLLANARSIAEARGQFRKLSRALIGHLKRNRVSNLGLIHVECSMGGGPWIQKSGPIKNPYKGAAMPACGTVKGRF